MSDDSLWKRITKLFGRRGTGKMAPPSLSSAMKALDESAAEAPKPTLVCRQCGLKYENTGTFLQGSRCPNCYPQG